MKKRKSEKAKSKKQKKKSNWLAKQYRQSWKYIKETKIHILIILITFILFILLGFLFPIFFEELILEFLEGLSKQIEGLDFFSLLRFILINNIKTSFLGVLLGIILGIVPILNTIVNGYVLGFIGRKSVEIAGPSILIRLLPHGIFEIPALILSLALGLKLSGWVLAKDKKYYLLHTIKNSLKVFIFIILPLLIIAGIIETSLMFFLN